MPPLGSLAEVPEGRGGGGHGALPGPPPLQPGVPGVAWAVPSPHGGAGLKAPLPASQTPRQTLGRGASDSMPDLPGSPRLWLMDDPPLSPPPPSKCCCLQGRRRPGEEPEKAWRTGWRGLRWPPLPPSSQPPACDPQVSPSQPQLDRLLGAQTPPFSHC